MNGELQNLVVAFTRRITNPIVFVCLLYNEVFDLFFLLSTHSQSHTASRTPFRCGVVQARVATPPRSGCPVYPLMNLLT